MTLYFIMPGLIRAEDGKALPKAFAEKIAKQYGIDDVRDWAKGTLDGSKNVYYALLSSKQVGETEYDLNVALFLFAVEKNGEVKKIVQSKSWPCSNYRESCSVAINKNSIFLDHFGAGGVCTHGEETYQFKKRNGEFELIGVERTGSSCDGENDFYTTGKSINYLANQLIVWYEAGNKAADDSVIYRFINNHHEQKFSFPASKKWRLNEFSQDEYDAWENQAEIICARFEKSIKRGKFNVEQCEK